MWAKGKNVMDVLIENSLLIVTMIQKVFDKFSFRNNLFLTILHCKK